MNGRKGLTWCEIKVISGVIKFLFHINLMELTQEFSQRVLAMNTRGKQGHVNI